MQAAPQQCAISDRLLTHRATLAPNKNHLNIFKMTKLSAVWADDEVMTFLTLTCFCVLSDRYPQQFVSVSEDEARM